MSLTMYHCGRCGSLFQAEPGQDDGRVCGVCKQSPGTGEWPAETDHGDVAPESSASLEKLSGPTEGKVHRDPVKRRSNSLIPWIVVIWILLMGSALWVHRHDSAPDRAAAQNAGKGADKEGEKAAMLRAALPDCHRTLSGFLGANSATERSRFVADALAAAARMRDFHRVHPFPRRDPARIVRTGQALLQVDGEWVVWTSWQEGERGDPFDAVFRREDGAWVLDWDHFVRFSEYRWEDFLEGDGPDEGDFRLLAMEIPSVEKTQREEHLLRFALISPGAWMPSDTEDGPPEFVVDRRSDEGLLLQAAFAEREEGGGPFGGALVPTEPEGLVRVRVRVKRNVYGAFKKFEVERVHACHWIGGDDPGFDMGRLKHEAFGVD